MPSVQYFTHLLEHLISTAINFNNTHTTFIRDFMEFSFSTQSTFIFAHTRKNSKLNSCIKTINLNSKSLNLKKRMAPHLSMKQNFVIQKQDMAIILIRVFINLDYCIFYKKIFKCLQNKSAKA